MKRISIFTASFGEGHNTAARNIRDGLRLACGEAVGVEICDLYQRTNPRLNRGMQVGYSVAINRFPRFWKAVFGALGMRGVLESMLPTLGALRQAMAGHLREFRPDLIVSTYPVFSFLVREIRRRSPFIRAPLVTVVTDSTSINSAWYRCPSDHYILSDDFTAQALTAGGVDPVRLHVLGFPVSPRFAALSPLGEDAVAPPRRLLYLPSTRRRHTIACLDRLLRLPDIELTVATGRGTELYGSLQRAGFDHTPGVRLLGWTDRMPELMASHHLFLGKAGGAAVQETIAARLPFIVTHLVPGQEEGNVELIRKLEVGAVADSTPDGLALRVREAWAADGAVWRRWKSNLLAASKPDAAVRIAEFLRQLV